MSYLYSFAFLLLGTISGFSQGYLLKQKSYTIEDGLLNNYVIQVYSDSRGFTWLGSDDGLNRYDGQKLVEFSTESGHLLDNNIGQINEDLRGNLWLLHTEPSNNRVSTISIFNPKLNQSYTLEDYLEYRLPIAYQDIKGIAHAFEQGHILIYTDSDEVYLVDGHSMETTQIHKHEQTITNAFIRNEKYWLVCKSELIQLDLNGKVLNRFDHSGKPFAFGMDKDDELVYFNYSPETEGYPKSIIYADGKPISFIPDKEVEHLKIMTVDVRNSRIWATDKRTGNYVVYTFDGRKIIDTSYGLERFNFFYPCRIDSKGIVWGNYGGRVFKFSLVRSGFKTYMTGWKDEISQGYDASGIQLIDEVIYLNGNGNTQQIDLKSGQSNPLILSTGFYPRMNDNSVNPLEETRRLGLFNDKKGNLWLADQGSRLSRLNLSSLRCDDFPYQNQMSSNLASEASILHYSIHIDQYGKLWTGHLNGISYLSPKDSLQYRYDKYGSFPTLKESTVFHFLERGDTLWLATTSGVYLLDQNKGIVDRYHVEGPPGRVIPHNAIAHINTFEKDVLWLSSRGGGMIRLDLKDNSYKQFTIKDGLSHNTINAIYKDDYGYFWVSTVHGIMQISEDNFEINTYYASDGLAHDESALTSHFQANDGRILVGGKNGVTMFDPKDFIQIPEPTAIIISKLSKQSIEDGEYHDATSELIHDKKVSVLSSELGFILEYSVLDFESERIKYSYKIEGVDQNWTYTDQPEVSVRSLPYGEYTLVLSGRGTGRRSSEEKRIQVAFLKPFYLKTWFFAMVTVLVIIVVFLLIKYRERNLKKAQLLLEQQVSERTEVIQQQTEELKKLDKIKSRFFANISHELRTPLSLIIGPVSNLLTNKKFDDQTTGDLQLVERSGKKISHLISEILDLAKLDNHKVQTEYTPVLLSRFFNELFSNFEFESRKRNITYQFDFDGDESTIAKIDLKKVDKIVNNLLFNAFKFTPSDGEITARATIETNSITVTVQDNGRGIKEDDLPKIFDRFYQTGDETAKAEGGWGIGLAMSYNLAKLMDGDITVLSQWQQGSTFTLTLPLQIVDMPLEIEKSETEDVDSTVSSNSHDNQDLDLILLVEDHEELRGFIKSTLNERYDVALSNNGVEALEYIDTCERKISAIVTDVMMPEMDGLTLLKKLKGKDSKSKDIPVLVLTARTVDDIKLEAFRLGVDDYLLKPFSVDELKARIKNLVQIGKNRSEHGSDEQIQEFDFDQSWLSEVKSAMEEHLSDHNFNLGLVAEKMKLGERQFQRKLKRMTGSTPVVYLKEVRLQLARQHLENREFDQVSKVAHAVGFSDAAYFSRMYKERFGVLPNSYVHV